MPAAPSSAEADFRYGDIDPFPLRREVENPGDHARRTATITGRGVKRLHADREDDTARVVRESDDRLRQGDEGVTTIDIQEVEG
jgi:hypothetical protein